MIPNNGLKKLQGITTPYEVIVCIVILILGYFALFVPPEQAANLPMTPDEGQYAISASNLFSRGIYGVTLNHKDYPAQYPYGFPLMLLPAFYFWGPFVGNVTYMNFLLNMGVVILTYMLGRMVGGWGVGCVAALFLLGNHLFLRFSHRILTQGALACFFVLAAILLLRILEKRDVTLPVGYLGILGVVTGWISSLHASWVCLDMAVVIALCYIYRKNWRQLLHALLVVGGITSIFVSIQLCYNQWAFGGFLQNGYEYWNEIPALQLFSVDRFQSLDFGLLYTGLTAPSLSRLRGFFDSNHLTYYLSSVLGLQEQSVIYSPAATILIILGGYELLKKKHNELGRLLVFLTTVSLGALIILFMAYYYQANRFLIPILPLLGVLASVGTVSTFRHYCLWSADKTGVMAALVLGLLFFTDLSYTYARTLIQRGQPELAWERMGRTFMAKYVCAQQYNSLTERDAIITSALDINYISHFVLSGTERRYLPLVRNIMYVSTDPQLPNRNWRPLGLPVVVESPQVISSLLESRLPVYTDDLEEDIFKEEYQSLRSLFEWQAVGECSSFHIYRLHTKPSH